MHVVSVTNQKGGCGKTTTAINLGACIAQRGLDVLIVDLDPQAHATLGLSSSGAEPAAGAVHALLRDPADPAPAAREVRDNLHLLPAGDELMSLETELAAATDGEERLRLCLQRSTRRWDLVVVDCPPSFGALTRAALRACNTILIPVEVGFFSLNGVGNFLRTIRRIRPDWLTEKKIRAVVTLFDRQTSFAREVHEEIRRFFGEALYSTVIHRNVRLKEATSYGLPVLDYDKRARGTEDYTALASEVVRDILPEAAGRTLTERLNGPGIGVPGGNDPRAA
ncbi:MAG TPA: ParA family protein [Candidatus Saccharimonadales bacterium]|nr:ParA family protein [Candidatus Saccharimonadales bacterium]